MSVTLLLFPLAALLLRSLHPDPSGALSLDAYRRLTTDFGGVVPVKALLMSLVTAAQAARSRSSSAGSPRSRSPARGGS